MVDRVVSLFLHVRVEDDQMNDPKDFFLACYWLLFPLLPVMSFSGTHFCESCVQQQNKKRHQRRNNSRSYHILIENETTQSFLHLSYYHPPGGESGFVPGL